ncbi:MAG TPA: YbjN domain-containing protein [Candidatus Choladousia intestinigallinarum]|nr:YbjN domain-containing protein [Candidatus Choladousia intestinigallinarum]
MKKILCTIFAVSTLILSSITAAASEDAFEDARKIANAQAMKAVLDANEYSYDFSEDRIFEMSFTLDDTSFDSCKVWAFAKDDGVKIQADYTVKADEDVRDEVASFFIRMNNKLNLGEFYMDYENGLMGYEVYVYSEDATPSQKALDTGLNIAVAMSEYGADGVANIIYGGYTAEQAYGSYE